jgi:hypothetical protein
MASPLGAGRYVRDLRTAAGFLSRLPRYLHHPVTVAEARAALRQRLDRRDSDFLALVRRAVYENPGSPYRTLLAAAGCEYGDLERLIVRDGLESTLRALLRAGVYLTVSELKGRRPVARGSTKIDVNPSLLRNPLAALHVPVSSSGGRGAEAVVNLDLGFLREVAVDQSLVMMARNGLSWRHAVWMVPGGSGFKQVLKFSAIGSPPVRWFSQLDPSAPGLDPRYRWTTELIRFGSRLAGRAIPAPLHVSVHDPLPVIRWMLDVLQSGQTPHLFTFVSSAVRLSQVARRAGLDLDGARFSICGEPVTEARLAEIRAAGGVAVPQYGATETSTLGFGCLSPAAPDDLHLLHDMHAFIQPETADGGPELPPRAMLVTSLRAAAPLVLLNVSLGDQAIASTRACGCPLEELGWVTHLRAIRSYEKLTAGGMTFLDSDLVRVLEEVLPERFGGGPTDYQLEEDEAVDGRPRLRLIVNPSVGALDERKVVAAFLEAIAPGSGTERVMGLIWQESEFVEVVRCPPRGTSTGKILHLVTPNPSERGARAIAVVRPARAAVPTT